MNSYSKALSLLVYTSLTRRHDVSAHSIPKDYDIEKFAAELEQVRVNSNDGEFLDGHEFVAPTKNSSRSPCPFINIMANHGFVNRSGRDIPVFNIAKLAVTMYDLPEISFTSIINAAIYAGQAIVQENGDTLLDLDRLWDRPGEERDASMVFPNPGTAWPKTLLVPGIDPINTERDYDKTFQKFRRTVNVELLERLLSKNPGSDVLTMEDMNSHLYDRILESRRDDPFFLWGQTSRLVAAGQYFLPVVILGENENDFTEVPKEYIKTLFLEDRLPDDYMPHSMRYPNFNVTKYLTDQGTFTFELYSTAIKAETADLGSGQEDPFYLRGNIKLDTM